MRHKLHAHWTLRAALHVVRFVGRVCCVMHGICGLCGHRVPFVPQREEHLRRVGEFDFGRPVGGLHHTVECCIIGCIAASSVVCCMVYAAALSDEVFVPLRRRTCVPASCAVPCPSTGRRSRTRLQVATPRVACCTPSPRHVSHVAHRRHATRPSCMACRWQPLLWAMAAAARGAQSSASNKQCTQRF